MQINNCNPRQRILCGFAATLSFLVSFSTYAQTCPGAHTFVAQQYPVSPGGGATVDVLRVGEPAGEVSVQYFTQDITARAGVDYTPVSGTVTFGPNDVARAINIPVFTRSTGPKTFYLILQGNGTQPPITNAVVTINADCQPGPVYWHNNSNLTQYLTTTPRCFAMAPAGNGGDRITVNSSSPVATGTGTFDCGVLGWGIGLNRFGNTCQ